MCLNGIRYGTTSYFLHSQTFSVLDTGEGKATYKQLWAEILEHLSNLRVRGSVQPTCLSFDVCAKQEPKWLL